jgi:hypothetical protein
MRVKIALQVGAETLGDGLGQRALDHRQGLQVLRAQFRRGNDQADPGRPLAAGLVGAGILLVERPGDRRRQRLSRRTGAQLRRDPAGPGNGQRDDRLLLGREVVVERPHRHPRHGGDVLPHNVAPAALQRQLQRGVAQRLPCRQLLPLPQP